VNTAIIKIFDRASWGTKYALIVGCLGLFWFEKNALSGAIKIYTKSADLLRVFKNSEDTYERKFVKSCRPLRAEVGKCYYFVRSTMFTYLDAIVSNTISLLIL